MDTTSQAHPYQFAYTYSMSQDCGKSMANWHYSSLRENELNTNVKLLSLQVQKKCPLVSVAILAIRHSRAERLTGMF